MLELPSPDLVDRRDILALHARGLALDADVDLSDVAERTEGSSGADLELVLKKAVILALEESRQCRSAFHVTRCHIEEALEQVKGAALPAVRSLGCVQRSVV